MTKENIDILEAHLIQAEIEEKVIRTRGMKHQIRHNKLVIFFLAIESVLLMIIAYGLLK